MEKEATEALGEGAYDALGPAVLLRGVGASEMENDAVSGQELAERLVVKLSSIVGVEGEDGPLELGTGWQRRRGK